MKNGKESTVYLSHIEDSDGKVYGINLSAMPYDEESHAEWAKYTVELTKVNDIETGRQYHPEDLLNVLRNILEKAGVKVVIAD